MNIAELDNLITHLQNTPAEHTDLIKYYQNKRVELVAKLGNKINNILKGN
jgi:hypothetical protein